MPSQNSFEDFLPESYRQAFNPEMLKLARNIRNITQKHLSKSSEIDQSIISRYERGILPITTHDLERIAQTLSFPPRFFLYDYDLRGPDAGEILHRKRKSVSAAKRKEIDGLMDLYWILLTEISKSIKIVSPFEITTYRLESYNNDPEEIASMVRNEWEIASGPIQDLIITLEDAGCFVVAFDFGIDKFDEAVKWAPPTRPLIAVNTRAPGERLRFTLAHALGHLVMHQGMFPKDTMEPEADRFASAFLMPKKDIISELEPVTIEHMLQLKSKWKVSMQALLVRSRNLQVISETEYQALYKTLGRIGYRTKEPYPIEPERPTQLRELIAYYKEKNGLNNQSAAGSLRVFADDFRDLFYSVS